MSHIKIAPSILSFDLAEIGLAVDQMAAAGVDWIHFDVMDGQFVPPITFGDSLVRALRRRVDIPFEVHLMTETPERHFHAFIDAGCRRVIFHHEATDHSHYLCKELRARGVEAGVAINPGTPIEVVRPLLDVLDLVLVMTVNPGWGGQKMIESCLKKVQVVRQWAPDIEIEIDGGVDPTTISQAIQSGVNTFVVGSYLLSEPTISIAIERLRAVCGAEL